MNTTVYKILYYINAHIVIIKSNSWNENKYNGRHECPEARGCAFKLNKTTNECDIIFLKTLILIHLCLNIEIIFYILIFELNIYILH